MGDRTRIRYTEAEKVSFELCPETCPAIEAAFDNARNFDYKRAEETLRSYGIEPSKNLMHAIDAVIGKAVRPGLHDLRNVVLYQGTFPLRLALVQRIEQDLSAQGRPQPTSNFAMWLAAAPRQRGPVDTES